MIERTNVTTARAMRRKVAVLTAAVGLALSLGAGPASAAAPPPSDSQDGLIWTTEPAAIQPGMTREEALKASSVAAGMSRQDVVAMAAAPAPVTWAGCGIAVDPNKVVRTYDRSKVLRCGNSNWGYFHIKERHGSNPANSNDWMSKAAVTGQNWRDVADQGIWGALLSPTVVKDKPANDTQCFSKVMYLVRLSDGKTVGTTYAQVVAAVRSNNIITAYPATKHCT